MRSIKIGRSCPSLPGQNKQDHMSRIAGGIAQVTEHLPSKYKNLEFKPQYGEPPLTKETYCTKTHSVITISNVQYNAIH
jgi:hypothetical protein